MKRTHTPGLAGFLFMAALVLAPAAHALDDKVQEPLASIHGMVQSSTAKALVVETEEPNSVEFVCTRKTRYFQGKKKIRSSDLTKGDLVMVESRPTLLGEAEAVNVYRTPEKLSERK
jgi:hypothetical protein